MRVRHVVSVLGVVSLTALATTASAATSALPPPGYVWDNVTIHGGGYVPAIIFNPTEPGLVYARTDVGGAYRFDPATERWTPLLDHVGWDDWGHSGVLSLATDPVETNRVYAAVGSYTISWDPNNGAIKRSTDYGQTWQTTDLPFKVGGNMPGRGIGERLAIDPNDTSVLYYGAEAGAGLWRSGDHGETWSEVTSFPNEGSFAPDPSSEWELERAELGVLWTAFVAGSGSAGSPTPTLLTAVADTEDMLYRSDDAGATWTPVAGAPTGFLPHQFAVDETNGYLYVTLSDGAGPYDGSDGGVWRYAVATGEWTDISPTFSPIGNVFGYSGLSIDASDPDTIVVATQIQWWPDNLLYRTTDGGQTWDPIWSYDWDTGEVDTRYVQDISASPWLTFGRDPQEPVQWSEPAPKLGWMMTSFAIDPFDPDHAMYGTGATIYRTTNLTDWSVENPVLFSVGAQGIEETAVQDLVTPPVDGVVVVSAMYDLGGFVHTDVAVAPDLPRDPYLGDSTSVDYAELEPEVLVRAGRDGDYVAVGISRDAGSTWVAGEEVDGATGPGTVAVGADGTAVVWSPEGSAGAQVTTDDGATWDAVVGLPAGARVASDRADAAVFYAAHAGTFFVSTDGGATFAATSDALPAEGNLRLAATPGAAGDVWVAGGTDDAEVDDADYGLWHSTDRGETFVRVEALQEADTIGFGANVPGAEHLALYSSARVDGVRGIYRSLDGGSTWQRINDDDHQWAWTGAAITGDLREFGTVYIATNGRGIVRGTTDVVPELPQPPDEEEPDGGGPGDGGPGDGPDDEGPDGGSDGEGPDDGGSGGDGAGTTDPPAARDTPSRAGGRLAATGASALPLLVVTGLLIGGGAALIYGRRLIR